jgi:FSR family fosmidomycin resistance protein-like MFS transporter
MTFSGSLCQVLYAYLGDRWGRKPFVVAGPMVAAFFMSFIALAPSFPVLLALMLMAGMGISAFHPHAASFVGASSGTKRGFGLSIFMTVGTAGFALGPLISTAIVSSSFIGPARMPLFSVAGLFTSLLLYRYAIPQDEHRRTRKSINILSIVRPHIGTLVLLSMIVVLRATVGIVFTNFLSYLMEQRELSLIIGGSTIFLFLVSMAVGTLLGGHLYDRISRKKLLIYSLLLSSPLLYALVHAHGAAFIILLILAGVVLGCPNPVPLAMAQELIPEGASTASSIMMGLSWGIAGLPAWLFARLADSFGGDVVPPMSIAAALPLLAVVLVFLISQKQGSSPGGRQDFS